MRIKKMQASILARSTEYGLRHWSALALLAVCYFHLLPSAYGRQRSPTPPHAGIYQRATNEFTQAMFFKPSGTNEEDLIIKMAPLIIQEVTGTNGISGFQDQFGTLGAAGANNGVPEAKPTIFFEPDSVQIHGKTHTRFTYLWFYPQARQSSKEKKLLQQGVRITLDSAGLPAIWEVLADSSGAELIFVSQSLETAARKEYGKPLPGRHHAIERSLKEAPKAVVARVLDDGPVPMGPIVYLNAETRSVSAVICRCMPVQAKNLLSARLYDLAPMANIPPEISSATASTPTGLWPRNGRTERRLEKVLRLPKNF